MQFSLTDVRIYASKGKEYFVRIQLFLDRKPTYIFLIVQKKDLMESVVNLTCSLISTRLKLPTDSLNYSTVSAVQEFVMSIFK